MKRLKALRFYRWVLLLGGFFSLNTLEAATFEVSSADEIEEALERAGAGDTLVMADGVWIDQEIRFAGQGVPDRPLTLRAKTPGNVILTGSSRLSILGQYLVVDGLYFKGGTPNESSHIVRFREQSSHCRFTNSVIESYNPPDLTDRYFWLSLYGSNNRVDHNRFINQNHSGVTLVVWLEDQPVNHQIDHNHFVDRPEGDGNGYETMRIGTSKQSNTNAHVIVEKNLFERVDGEIEIISNKSNDNTFRHNTFRNAKGTLTLRHGHRARVEGNFFLGMGKQESGGIRVIGEDHVIINKGLRKLSGLNRLFSEQFEDR